MNGVTNYCKTCNVYVDGCLKFCPLCKEKLTDNPSLKTMYPKITEVKIRDKKNVVTDLLIFISCITIIACTVINILTFKGVPWFLCVSAPIIYLWVLIKNTIMSDMFSGAKVLFQMLALSGLFLALDFVGGKLGWSYEFFIPLVIAFGIAYMDFYAYIHKSYWRENLIYALVFVLLGFIPLLFYILNITHLVIPTFLSTFAAGMTILGILRFALRYFKVEVKKRFHL